MQLQNIAQLIIIVWIGPAPCLVQIGTERIGIDYGSRGWEGGRKVVAAAGRHGGQCAATLEKILDDFFKRGSIEYVFFFFGGRGGGGEVEGCND